MFSFLRNNVIGRRQFSIRVVETPFLLRSSSAISSIDHTNSFTVSYLINSCGLSQEKALSLSKKVHFETSTKPDSVLAFFKTNGFPNTYISKIIKKEPSLLLSKVDKTLKPKFDFFTSKGLSGPDLAKILSLEPNVLWVSLGKKIIPSFAFLETIVQTESRVIALLKRSTRVLRDHPQKRLAPNIALLQTHGVANSNIEKLLVCQPMSFLKTTSRFKEIVKELKKMDFEPSQPMFVLAISGLASMTKSTLEAKFNVYRRWGWSEDEIHCAFRKQPHCMMLSEKKIMGTMDYLVNKIGYDPSLLAKQPGVLMYSFEKRIIPRCSVIQILIANGLVEKERGLRYFLVMNDKKFLEFVAKFGGKIHELDERFRTLLKCYCNLGS